MATVSIRITGVEEVNLKLDRLKGIDWAVTPMNQSVFRLWERLALYPPELPNSTYKRTTVLGKGWTKEVERAGNTVTGTVGNRVKYAPWVQSRNFQAGIHRGRWKTEADIAEEETQNIVNFFRAAIERATR